MGPVGDPLQRHVQLGRPGRRRIKVAERKWLLSGPATHHWPEEIIALAIAQAGKVQLARLPGNAEREARGARLGAARPLGFLRFSPITCARLSPGHPPVAPPDPPAPVPP